jgi:hypothetical protein
MREQGTPVKLITHGFAQLEEDPRSGGSPDRIVECLTTGTRWVLEIKTRMKGDARLYVPNSHKLQMIGLCEAYKLPFAHYACWTPNQCIQFARMDYDREEMWVKRLLPVVKEYKDWIFNQVKPPRMKVRVKQERLAAIDDYVRISPIVAIDESSDDDTGTD